MSSSRMRIATIVCTAMLGASLTACENKGPVEQAGEEVDEAVDTLKNGKESTATKLDDAGDEIREGVNDAKDELKSN